MITYFTAPLDRISDTILGMVTFTLFHLLMNILALLFLYLGTFLQRLNDGNFVTFNWIFNFMFPPALFVFNLMYNNLGPPISKDYMLEF